jgi:hypothetical protein
MKTLRAVRTPEGSLTLTREDLRVADIQSVVRVVARSSLLARCTAGDNLAAPVKAGVSLVRGEFEKTADFERRRQNAEHEAERAYQQALKARARATDCQRRLREGKAGAESGLEHPVQRRHPQRAHGVSTDSLGCL